MASTTPRAGRVSPDAGKHGRPQRHVHHGRTLAAWVGSSLALFAIILGAVALIPRPNWTLFWIAAAIAVVAMIATKVLQRLGYGAD